MPTSRESTGATRWALLLIAALGTGLDGIAERQAERYVEAIGADPAGS